MNKFKITTRYKVGDTVYVMCGNHICKTKIDSIHITLKHESNTIVDISYEITDAFYYGETVPEDKLFSSPKEATAKLLDDFYNENEEEKPMKKFVKLSQ